MSLIERIAVPKSETYNGVTYHWCEITIQCEERDVYEVITEVEWDGTIGGLGNVCDKYDCALTTNRELKDSIIAHINEPREITEVQRIKRENLPGGNK